MVAAPRRRRRANSADLARLKAHIGAVQTMTANFIADRRPRPLRRRHAAAQAAGPGPVPYGSGDLLLVPTVRRLTSSTIRSARRSSWPLAERRLAALLSDSPDFKGKAQILPSDDARVVVARAKNTAQYGQLTLAFLRSGSAPGGLQLYGWTAIDPQNHRTTVKLTNVRYNVAVPDSAFTLRRAEEAIG